MRQPQLWLSQQSLGLVVAGHLIQLPALKPGVLVGFLPAVFTSPRLSQVQWEGEVALKLL